MITAANSRLALCCLSITSLGPAAAISPATAAQHIMIDSSAGGITQTFAPGRFSNLLQPDYTRRDLAIILKELQITRDQRFVLQVLLDDYTDSFNKAVEQFKAVQDRFDGPDRPMAGLGSEAVKRMTDTVLESLQDNLAIKRVVQLQGGGGTFVGILQTEVSGGGGGGNATWVGGAIGGGGEGGDQMIELHVAVLASVEEDHEGHEAGAHTIPPEVLVRLQTSIRERLEERFAARRDEMALAIAEIAAREARREAGEEEEASADDVAKAARTLLAQRRQLKNEFESDLMLLLPDEQAEAWPAVDRHLRRLNTLSKGQFAGESLDLFRLLDEVSRGALPGAGDLPGATLIDYEMRLNYALSNRNQYLTESEVDSFLAWAEQDFDKTIELMERESDLRLAVRDVNDEFIQTIASGLDASQATSFRQAARERSYRAAYRKTREQRLFGQAKAIEQLDPDVLGAIINLETRYLEELAVAIDHLVATIHDFEPTQRKRMIELMQKVRSGSFDFQDRPANPIMDGHRQRRQLGRRYAKQLKSLLTQEQYDNLPGAKQQEFGSFTIQRDG